jgi:UDP-glucuronate 4-epimerase
MEHAVSILVTGGAGFIGSAVAADVLGRGERAVVLDSFDETLYDEATKRRNLTWLAEHGSFDLVEGDVRDVETLAEVFGHYPIDHVVHAAAAAGVRASIAKPALYFDVNVTGTARLLQAGRRAGLTDLVLASSSSVYGGNHKTPFAETDAVNCPMSPYAASKRAMELLCAADVSLHGGNISCLRFFTVYGPRQRPDMAIHMFMRLLSAGEAIPMFGDGSSARDYCYIDDVVAAVRAALERPRGFRLYNVGGDRVTMLRELIDLIGEVGGVAPRIEELPVHPGDVSITHADLTRAREELGYAPRTTLREGLERMWQWYRRQLELPERRALRDAPR